MERVTVHRKALPGGRSEWYVYQDVEFVAGYRTQKRAEQKAAELRAALADAVKIEESDPYPGTLSRSIGRDYR